MNSTYFDVVVVGGGFSGTILAVQLLCRDPSLRVAIVEKGHLPGRGLAYSTEARFHLLNLPAQNMSALPAEPDDFVRWAQAHYNPSVQPRSFLPRSLFGRYVAARLDQAIAAGDRERFQWIGDEAVSLERRKRNFALHRGNGPELLARTVVLAQGNFPPANPRIRGLSADCRRYVPLAWSKTALADLPPNGRVLLLGSGLTSLDLVMALKSKGFRGEIHIVSRRGLVPQRHERTHPWPQFWNEQSPRSVRGLLRLIRSQARLATLAGSNWRAAVDALRPVTQQIWQSLPLIERRRFLRHARAYWEVHRHRIAPEIADVLANLIEEGQVRIYAGRVTRYVERQAFAEVSIRQRNTRGTKTLRVDRMINCTGSENDCRCIDDPVLNCLFRQGLARPDALFLGLDVDENGALIDTDGTASKSLHALGPMRKGCLWETTAVPEIRAQADGLAEHLIRRLGRDARPKLAEHAATLRSLSALWR